MGTRAQELREGPGTERRSIQRHVRGEAKAGTVNEHLVNIPDEAAIIDSQRERPVKRHAEGDRTANTANRTIRAKTRRTRRRHVCCGRGIYVVENRLRAGVSCQNRSEEHTS